jgi:predicted Zn-ribbon and HTH transcriptional regulator
MSQSEILELLEKENKPLTLSQICTNLNQDKSKICKQLKTMIHYKEIRFTEIDRNEAQTISKNCKRRIKIYHLEILPGMIMPVFIIKSIL